MFDPLKAGLVLSREDLRQMWSAVVDGATVWRVADDRIIEIHAYPSVGAGRAAAEAVR